MKLLEVMMVLIFSVIFSAGMWHLLAPEQYHWLTPPQLAGVYCLSFVILIMAPLYPGRRP